MTTYGVRWYEEDEGLDNQITDRKSRLELSVFLQNPDGVMAQSSDLDKRRAMISFKELDVDVIALPETNRNWQ